MRILIVSEDPEIVGGIPTYTTRLAKAFTSLGHSVFHFQSGSPILKYDIKYFPYLYEYKSDDVHYATIINSPNFLHNSHHPIKDIFSEPIRKIFLSYLNKIKPDIIHVNSMIGLCTSMLDEAVKIGIPVINTFHEYWYICQQRVLLEKGKELCNGPSPEKCFNCMPKINPLKIRIRGLLRNTNIVETYKKIRKIDTKSNLQMSCTNNQNKPLDYQVIEEYKKRLEFNVDQLSNKVAINLAVSSFVKEKFMEYGVPESKIEVLSIGTSIAEQIKPKDISSIDIQNKTISFGFIGSAGEIKGTHVLVSAFQKMKNKNAILNIYGKINPVYLDFLKTISMDNPQIIFHGAYKYNDLPTILNEVDVIVVPALCYDTMPQTIFEAFSSKTPVIGSKIGGIPDFVIDNETGLLFEPGNEDMLAEKMDSLVSSPSMIVNFHNQIKPMKKMKIHSEELIEIYENFITS